MGQLLRERPGGVVAAADVVDDPPAAAGRDLAKLRASVAQVAADDVGFLGHEHNLTLQRQLWIEEVLAARWDGLQQVLIVQDVGAEHPDERLKRAVLAKPAAAQIAAARDQVAAAAAGV